MALPWSSNQRSVLLLLLLLVINSPSYLAQDNNSNNNNDAGTCSSDSVNNDGVCQDPGDSEADDSPKQQCSLYMAPSTIPHAGLGIFTGVPRYPGDSLGSGDVLIPVIDLWYHLDAPSSEEHLDPTSDYIWHGPEMGMQQETSHPLEYVSAFAPGLDAAINCHLGLINVDKNEPVYDVSGLHRSTDPGVGAITPYHNCTTSVIKQIPAGGELFKDYGDHWFVTRPYAFSTLPLKDDFRKAEHLVKKFYTLSMGLRVRHVSQEALSDLWGVVTSINYSRTINALPAEYEAVSLVAKKGMRAYYQPSGTRDLQDLDKTGRCLDIVKPAKSTMAQAGRGLFATRLLRTDSIVAGTPLIQVQDGRFFDLFGGDWFDKEAEPDRNEVVGHQIMMNYCWKHAESPLYLCPYGAGVNYVNHGSSRGDDTNSEHKKANVRLQWAADGDMGHDATWLSKPPEGMGYKASPGLFIDLVATRDIMPGEEILMDYGPEWEAAWQEHLDHWNNRDYKYAADYQSARDWNKENGETVLRTETEQEVVPYPSHMEVRCLDGIATNPDMKHAEAARRWTLSESGIRCNILERREAMEGDRQDHENGHYYKVLYAPKVWDAETEYYEHGDEWYESDWIARGALSFVDRPYSTDLHLEDAFRHPIGFPDALLPDAWRNVEEEEELEE